MAVRAYAERRPSPPEPSSPSISASTSPLESNSDGIANGQKDLDKDKDKDKGSEQAGNQGQDFTSPLNPSFVRVEEQNHVMQMES